MRRLGNITLIALLAVVMVLLVSRAYGYEQYRHGTCQEDMPCWNCETMGNKTCGTTDKNGR